MIDNPDRLDVRVGINIVGDGIGSSTLPAGWATLGTLYQKGERIAPSNELNQRVWSVDHWSSSSLEAWASDVDEVIALFVTERPWLVDAVSPFPWETVNADVEVAVSVSWIDANETPRLRISASSVHLMARLGASLDVDYFVAPVVDEGWAKDSSQGVVEPDE